MKTYKKVITIILCVCVCIVAIYVVDTYAKYATSAQGTATAPIAKWNIKVNNRSIKNNTDITSVIQPVFPGNENIASGIIAPTAEGYFDLNLDFTDTDVAFKYEITIEPNPNSIVPDLVATGYTIDAGTRTPFTGVVKKIEEIIPLNSQTHTRAIRVYIVWDDSLAATMDNAADTLATSALGQALLNVTVTCSQVAVATQ